MTDAAAIEPPCPDRGVLNRDPNNFGAVRTVTRIKPAVSLVDYKSKRENESEGLAISLQIQNLDYTGLAADDRVPAIVADISFGSGNTQQDVTVDFCGALTVVGSFVRVTGRMLDDPGDAGDAPLRPLSARLSACMLPGVPVGRRITFSPLPRLIPNAGTLNFPAPPFARAVNIATDTVGLFAAGGGTLTQRLGADSNGFQVSVLPATFFGGIGQEFVPLMGCVQSVDIANTTGGAIFAAPVWEIAL
jgi:hypothetical protein